MLDFNHAHNFAEALNAIVDTALMVENANRPPRDYLGGSRVGHACERALQFEFAGAPKDDGADFSGQTLRIFAIGHRLANAVSAVGTSSTERPSCSPEYLPPDSQILSRSVETLSHGVPHPSGSTMALAVASTFSSTRVIQRELEVEG